MSELVSNVDSNKLIYPRGILSTISEADDDLPPVKRIELFAKDEKDTYGILRTMFVALSSEKSILQMATASDGIIQVRAISEKSDKSRRICEDKLLVKRTEDSPEKIRPSVRINAPNIIISARWRERMNLELKDRLIVSNPIEEFVVPPPNL
ncbi:MAG: hypothetical protein OK439_00500 [Thaumarchaeota archaeon]|nr:hypothetical protein [Nitrososphaerota archaeon]